ncbi:MAG: O-acetyl-ADP-ribose deacetylase [Lachnospiraceae bacterium]|nr:O-acetyl-ADP-ribose deacetylase [Lachnospiraceae bacterium]
MDSIDKKQKNSVSLPKNKIVQNKLVQDNIVLDKGDITKLACDCIVNAANKSLLGGGGVDGAIHRAAGKELLEECRTLHGCNTGEAKITKGYRLKAAYVIHTVGPIYSGSPSDEKMLSNCYRNSLDLARKHAIHSIAFPAISTGVYGYPLREAAPIALNTVAKWLEANRDYEMTVIMSCFDQATYDMYQSLIDNGRR